MGRARPARKPLPAVKDSCHECPILDAGLLGRLMPVHRKTLMAARHVRRYHRADSLFYDGNPALGVFFLCKGKVKIVCRNPKGRGQVVAVIRAPNLIGDRPLMAGEPYRAAAVVMEDSCLCSIEAQAFRKVIAASKEASLALAVRYARMLGEAWSLSAELSFGSVRQRMAAFILREKLGGGADPGRWIPLPETRREIAEIVGTSPEAVCRFLAQFHEEGLIAFDKDRFRVIDAPAIREVAAGPRRQARRFEW